MLRGRSPLEAILFPMTFNSKSRGRIAISSCWRLLCYVYVTQQQQPSEMNKSRSVPRWRTANVNIGTSETANRWRSQRCTVVHLSFYACVIRTAEKCLVLVVWFRGRFVFTMVNHMIHLLNMRAKCLVLVVWFRGRFVFTMVNHMIHLLNMRAMAAGGSHKQQKTECLAQWRTR